MKKAYIAPKGTGAKMGLKPVGKALVLKKKTQPKLKGKGYANIA